MKKLPIVLGLGGFLCLASANAQLAHRYNLSNALDSVGTANGTLNGGASFTGGQLVTTGPNTDYLALPASVGAGITGDFTIQTFFTIGANPNNFSSLFSLSSPGNRNFFLVNPARGNAGGNLSANFQQRPGQVNGGDDTEVDIRPGSNPLAFGAQNDLAITYVASTNTVTLYVNGVSVASGSIAAAVFPAGPFSLEASTSGGINGINGGGPFNDDSINGSTNDFRIYSSALTPAQVTAIDALGADASNAAIQAIVPEPATWVTMLLSLVALCGLQRFRRSQA